VEALQWPSLQEAAAAVENDAPSNINIVLASSIVSVPTVIGIWIVRR